LAFALALALTPGRPAAQAPSPRVLVLPFAVHAVTGSPDTGPRDWFWLGEGTAVSLTDALDVLHAGALSRDQRVAAFDRLQLPVSSALTRATMIRVGEFVGASEVVFGEVQVADLVTVRARVVRLQSGQELPAVVEQAPVSEVLAVFDRAARRLPEAMGRPAPAQGPDLAPRPPIDAFQSYVKGLLAPTPAGAQRFLESALKQMPRDARVLNALWSAYSAQGAHEKALAAAMAVPADSPLARKARFSAALSLIDLKRFDGAFKELTALNAERGAALVSNALGVVQLRRPTQPAAPPPVSFFARAVEQEPGNKDYLFNLGYAHALSGDVPNALSWLREAVRYDAAMGDAHLVMSAVLAASGRPVEAGRELDLAKLLGTRPEIAARTVGDKIPSSLERLPTVFDLAPPAAMGAAGTASQRQQQETAAFYLERGRALIAEHRDREAMDELKRAIYLSPYEDAPHLLLGRLHQRGGHLPEAIDEFKIAIWCRDSSAARVSLGGALLESGDRDGARREAERAVVLEPDSADAKALLKKIGGSGHLYSEIQRGTIPANE
jgi:tetratricopeptide (TPR) repeat protein